MKNILSEDDSFDTIYTKKGDKDLHLEGKGNPNITVRNRILIESESSLEINGSISFTSESNPIEIITKEKSSISTYQNIRFIGNTSLIKTGRGDIQLSNRNYDKSPRLQVMHQLGSVIIKEGLFTLFGTSVSVTGPIEIHAGARLSLYSASFSNHEETIIKLGSENRELRLRGSKKNSAYLTIAYHNQGFEKFYVENKAVISFNSTGVHLQSLIYLDQLIFDTPDSLLTIQGWDSGADHLLLKKDWGDARISELLSKIYFEGHGWANTWEASNLDGFDDYWEIRPFATPEPATYGAALGAVGLGLVAWRKRRGAAHKPPPQ